ncbi:hypothetical protein CAPTEDRAFT_93192, partial [Capitella teleta]|uniref:Neurotransmitter-gated ion-channel ligand-binding domain-containing protein n=1 Tax=Capitella teleta TaxID=283909 RepID=X2BBW4_CAPTE
WIDEYLTWDPASYGGLTTIKISPAGIWRPDIMLYNTATTDESERSVLAVVTSEGLVTWYPHQVFLSSCAVDVRNFPFDNQTCHLWYGSWTHNVDEMDLDLAFPAGIDLSTFKSVYKDASAWDIANCSAERILAPPEGGSQFAILSFTLHLNRKMMFSTYILTMPAIFLSFLTLLVFWLPPEHADKSALGLTIFGSLLLLLLILVETAAPTASAVPLLGEYFSYM